MVQNALELQHVFDPGLSGKGAKVLTVKPYLVRMQIIYEVGKDADNTVLHRDIERLWQAFCKIRNVKFQKEMDAAVKLVFIEIVKLKKSDVLLTDRDATIAALEAIIDKHNNKIAVAFQNWQDGFTREIQKTIKEWGKVNQDAALVRAKRVGKIGKDVLGITYAVINPVSIKGKLKLISKFRGLYRDVKSCHGNADKRARRVIKELGKLKKVLATMDSHQKAGKLIKWSAKFNSIGADLQRVMKSYESEVEILKSKVKKQGQTLRELQNSDQAMASNAVEKATLELEKRQTALAEHTSQLEASKRIFEQLKTDNTLFSMNDKLRAKLKKGLSNALNDADIALQKDVATMKNVQLLDGSIATLENGLKMNERGAIINI